MTTRGPDGLNGFSVRYLADGGEIFVNVSFGDSRAEFLADLPASPYQNVDIEDSRLPFRITSEVKHGRVTHLKFGISGEGEEIEQKHLRRTSIIPVIKRWARLGEQLQRVLDRDPSTEAWEGWIAELPAMASVQEAEERTKALIGQWLPREDRDTRQRIVGDHAQQLLERVVDRYRELIDQGERRPRIVIAEEENYTPEHIGRLLVKARKQGLLAPARIGKAGEIS
jgi:hypothetical protein